MIISGELAGLYILSPAILSSKFHSDDLVIQSFWQLLASAFVSFQNVLVLTSNAANPHIKLFKYLKGPCTMRIFCFPDFIPSRR